MNEPPRIAELLRTRKVIVCCGAGGVGKTTTSTGLALAAARMGRRVLALTVDPSKRLADTLGVDRNSPHPTAPSLERLSLAGIRAPGSLEAWMLDPQLVADRVVRALHKDDADVERLRGNRIYREVSRMVAGMQEYTAMEALGGFLASGRYDLVILDTPPSRHALDFLEGPNRLAEFMEGPVFQLFLPREDAGFLERSASKLLGRVLAAVFGDDNHRELQQFFSSFGSVLRACTGSAATMRATLSDGDQVAFLLVTSPASAAMTDVFFFRGRADELKLPFRGFVLNRSQAAAAEREMPTDALLSRGVALGPDVRRRAYRKLSHLAILEQAEVHRDQGLLNELARSAGKSAFAIALPTLPGGAHDMTSLLVLADALAAA